MAGQALPNDTGEVDHFPATVGGRVEGLGTAALRDAVEGAAGSDRHLREGPSSRRPSRCTYFSATGVTPRTPKAAVRSATSRAWPPGLLSGVTPSRSPAPSTIV